MLSNTNSKKLSVCTFYHYHSLEKTKLSAVKDFMISKGEIEEIRGLILISDEGINATLVGSLKPLKRYLEVIRNRTDIPIQARWQTTELWGFKKLRVKIKKEIVNSGNKELKIPSSHTHLSPEEWEAALDRKPTILDVRNDYEVELGKFKSAIDLKISQFQELSKKLKVADLPKDKETLIYCTGGVRCEKVLTEMKEQGFKDVKQLQGGILNYLNYFPNSKYEGECFVFDHRVSLNQNLEPSNSYKLCPHCGQPGQVLINCKHCLSKGVVCTLCHQKDPSMQTCSKNCLYHYRMGHKLKKKKTAQSPNAS